MTKLKMLALAPVLGMLALAVVALSAPAASAYGPLAQYQIGVSQSCNNPSFCGSGGLGGFWGWAEFDSDNTGDAQLTFCGHGGPGVGGGGAQHESVDATGWYIGDNGDFFVTSEIDTFTGHGPPVTEVISSENFDTEIPATPGHYSTDEILGFPAPPGVSFQIQVVKIPGH